MSVFKLNMELDQLLKKNPEIMDLQLEISKNLAKFDKSEDRMYYLSIELLDSFDKLKEELEKLEQMLKELK